MLAIKSCFTVTISATQNFRSELTALVDQKLSFCVITIYYIQLAHILALQMTTTTDFFFFKATYKDDF